MRLTDKSVRTQLLVRLGLPIFIVFLVVLGSVWQLLSKSLDQVIKDEIVTAMSEEIESSTKKVEMLLNEEGRRSSDELDKAFNASLGEFAETVAQACFPMVESFNIDGVRTFVSAKVKKQSQVSYVKLVTADDTVVYGIAPKNPLSAKAAIKSEFAKVEVEVQADRAIMEKAMEEQREHFNLVTDELKKSVTSLSATVAQRSVNAKHSINARMSERLLMVFAVAAFLLLVSGYLFNRALMKQLGGEPKDLVTVARKVAAGNLVVERSMEAKAGAGTESLADSINETVIKLRGVVGEIETSFREVERVSENLATTAESIRNESNQETEVVRDLEDTTSSLSSVFGKLDQDTQTIIASANDNYNELSNLAVTINEVAGKAVTLYDGATNSTQAIEEISTSISVTAESVMALSSTINRSAIAMSQIEESVRQIDGLTDKTKKISSQLAVEASENGRKAMLLASKEMKTSSAIVSALGVTVKEVGESSEEIGEIVLIIDEFADQTKLLALNASILAAQAGKHGKSFAIVAEEIRKLSGKINQSTKTVGELVKNIQDRSLKAIIEAEKGTRSVEISTGEVENLLSVIESIIKGVETTNKYTEEISIQTKQQTQASADVAQSLMEVSAMSEELAATSQQQDKAGRHVLNINQDMGKMADDMKVTTERQAQSVSEIEKKVTAGVEVSDRLSQSTATTQEAAAVVRTSMETIGIIAKRNQDRATTLQESVQHLLMQTELVRKKLSTFKLEEV